MLEKIRYIPDLKRNLISLGTLDDEGYKAIINKGIWNLQNNFIEIINVPKINGIYFFKGFILGG